MKDNFANSIRFDPTLTTNNRPLKLLAKTIYLDVRHALPPATRKKTIRNCYFCIAALLNNLTKSWVASQGMVSVQLGHDHFANRGMGDLTYKAFVLALENIANVTVRDVPDGAGGEDRIVTRSYRIVERYPGYFNRTTDFKEPTRLQLNVPEVMRYLADKKMAYGIDINMLLEGNIHNIDYSHIHSIFNHQVSKPITRTLSLFTSSNAHAGRLILKDAKKVPVKFEGTKETAQKQHNLGAINQFLQQQVIALYLPDSEFHDLQKAIGYQGTKVIRNGGKTLPTVLAGVRQLEAPTLHRVFNNERWDHGGRFYGGWWQAIPKRYRPRITINGRPTIELDFKSMQPSMLYHERGLKLAGDAYDLPGFPQSSRAVAKEAFLALLSAGPHQRITTLENLKYPTDWDALRIEDAIRRRHRSIEDAFRSEAGVRLQAIDAEIAELIMLRMAKEHYAAVLPIHDSFIVEWRFANQLSNVMQDSYRKVMNGGHIEIEHKPQIWEEIGRPINTNPDALFLHLFSMSHDGDEEYFIQFFERFRETADQYKTWVHANLPWVARNGATKKSIAA